MLYMQQFFDSLAHEFGNDSKLVFVQMCPCEQEKHELCRPSLFHAIFHFPHSELLALRVSRAGSVSRPNGFFKRRASFRAFRAEARVKVIKF